MELKSRPAKVALTAALVAAALATSPPTVATAVAGPARAEFNRTIRETVLAWDSGVEPPPENSTTGQNGMMLATRFQALPWATCVVAVQYFIMNDFQDNPQDPGAPTTRPFMVRVWRPGDGVPGASANAGYVPFSDIGEYPEEAWVEVELPEPIDITDPAEFPDRVFYVGLEWLYRNNPIIGVDFVPPIDAMSFRFNWTAWELMTGDVMIRAVVRGGVPEIIHVDLAGGGDFLTIQEGIDAAAEYDTVRVAPGTYTGPLNRGLTFDGKNIAVVSEAGPDLTVIDCEGADRGFFLTGGESPAALIRGFTVRNGVGSGGAIRCVNAAPTIVHCVFEDTEGGPYGGAIFLTDPIGGPPRIEQCVFSANSSTGFGGAVRLDYSDAVFDRCTFVENGAPTGGAIDCGTLSFPRFTNSVFAFGIEGGVVHCPPSSAPAVTHCCVFGNAGGDSLCGDHHDNLFLDPFFCPDDLTLYDDSPCLPGNNPWGEPIGARGAGGCGSTTGVPEEGMLALHSPRPNPTNGTTTIAFDLPFAARVSFIVYSASGRRVRTILDEAALGPGPHEVVWDGRDPSGRPVASGVYVCELEAGGRRARRTIVVLW